VGVGRLNEGRRRLRSGEEDGVRINGDVGDAGIGIGVLRKRRPSCCKLGGAYVVMEGDESGVSMPLSYRSFPTRDSASSQLGTELGRLSREEDASRQ